MKTRTLIHSLVCALVGASFLAQADVVTDWNTLALNAIRTNKTAPPIASRNLAILHVAIFDAVNGVKQPHEQKYRSYLKHGHPKGKPSEEAAASAAAHLVLVNLFPAQQAMLDAEYSAALAGIPDGKSKDRGVDWGEIVAEDILAARANDGSTAVVPLPPGVGPGFWIPTPPAFAPYLLLQWAFVTPFAVTSGSQFRPPGPPALSSAQWVADYNEVKALGAAVGSTRTAEQSLIARFWADGAGTETPPGHWNSIAQDVAAAQGNISDENARLFALLNIAMADAAICCWDAKYTFNFWRPVTAIRNGDTDGNPLTDPDPAWSSFIGTPPFPDYISGHSTFSGAAATVLALFYGTDDIAFDTGSDILPGVNRHFEGFSDAAAEAALSRLYGGIHFWSANEDGLHAGIDIGEHVMKNVLKPTGKGKKSKQSKKSKK